MDTSESEHGEEGHDDDWVNAGCSCTKYSSCKTTKCECRADGGRCGTSCGCVATKCANRGSASTNESGESPETEIFEGSGSGSGSDEKEKSDALASHGAMLLQSALVEKPADTNDENGPRRKPLSDIGNTLVCLIKLMSYHSSLISSLQIQCCWLYFVALFIVNCN